MKNKKKSTEQVASQRSNGSHAVQQHVAKSHAGDSSVAGRPASKTNTNVIPTKRHLKV